MPCCRASRIRNSRIALPAPLTPPLADHCHATDMAIGQQPAGPHRQALGIKGQPMQRYRIGLVPLEVFRNKLLDDKHRSSQHLQHCPVIEP